MTLERISRAYRWFAEHEAPGRSELYVELAAGVASDRELLRALADLPPAKRQPNLLFTSLRYVCGEPNDFGEFRTCFASTRRR